MSSATANVNDFANRKGSLTLRSDHMNYGRAVLNCKWQLAREAEPKDYNFNKHPIRNFAFSTYRRLAAGDEPIPETTYNSYYNQVFNKDYTEREERLPIVDHNSALWMHLNRETGHPSTGYGAVLSRHAADRRLFHDETTHRTDFQLPYPYSKPTRTVSAPPDNSLAYRRCNSQFTDTADYRRPGRNTYWDESGVYANVLLRRECQPYWCRHPAMGEEPRAPLHWQAATQ